MPYGLGDGVQGRCAGVQCSSGARAMTPSLGFRMPFRVQVLAQRRPV
jgi:hypothetical protein